MAAVAKIAIVILLIYLIESSYAASVDQDAGEENKPNNVNTKATQSGDLIEFIEKIKTKIRETTSKFPSVDQDATREDKPNDDDTKAAGSFDFLGFIKKMETKIKEVTSKFSSKTK
ncbi:unnamed protein product [Parnassius apollo]|uniref:(apollo) hypothetical protein n=1 Tax=Parnassius apollo TaxID=110799 RepID=A0A8S3Y4E0_PARAO|nr:unnamed protein product [Parnassius apollo]